MSELLPAEQLEQLWFQGEAPDVHDFISNFDSLTPEQLSELLRVDQRQRHRLEEGVPAEVYLAKYPTLEEHPEAAVDLIYNEYLLRERAGERVEPEDYFRRFPRHLDTLRVQIRLHKAIVEDPTGELLSSMGGEQVWRDSSEGSTQTATIQVAGYSVLEELGRGGAGIVYKARQIRLNRIVALKMLRPGGLDVPERQRRFLLEAEVVARVNHANIVQLYEIGEVDGIPFLVLEYMAGGSLSQYSKGSPQAPRFCAELVALLAKAVHYAHQQGVVHRDLKPGNVLLGECAPKLGSKAPMKAEELRPKISDFGLAKHLATDTGETWMGNDSGEGTIVGTPSYMAPEQAQGIHEGIGPLVDVYSLGAILYELLTGRPPFRGRTALDTLQQAARDEPVLPSRLQPKCPRDLETICLKALAKDPERRYPSASDLAEDLERYLAGRSILARPSHALEKGWLWCKRNPWLASSSAIALGLLLAVTVVSLLFARHKYADALESKRQRVQIVEAWRKEQRLTGELTSRIREERRRSAALSLDDALEAAHRDNVGSALVLLTRALDKAIAAGDVVLERSIRRNLTAWGRSWSGLRARLEGAPPTVSIYSHDGTTVAGYVPSEKRIRFWSVETGLAKSVSIPDQEDVVALAFAAGNGTLWVGVASGRIECWQLTPLRRLGAVRHPAKLLGIATAPKGPLLVSFGENRFQVWDAERFVARSKPTTGVGDRPGALALSPRGRWALAIDSEGAANLWKLTPPMASRALGKVDRDVLTFDGEEERLAVVRPGNRVEILKVEAGVSVGKSLRHSLGVASMLFLSGRGFLRTMDDEGTLRHWDLATLEEVGPSARSALPIPTNSIEDPSGRTFLGGEASKLPRALVRLGPHAEPRSIVWEASAGPDCGPTLLSDSSVRGFGTTSTGKLVLASAGAERAQVVLRWWNVESGKVLAEPGATRLEGESLAFAPKGDRAIVLGSKVGSTIDLLTGRMLGKPLEMSGAGRVTFDPSGTWALLHSAKEDGTNTFQLVNVRTGELRGRPREERPQPAQAQKPPTIEVLAVSPDGTRYVRSETLDRGSVFRFLSGTFRLRFATFDGSLEVIPPDARKGTVAFFDPTGKWWCYFGADGSARLCDGKTGKPHVPIWTPRAEVLAGAFDRSGSLVLTGSSDGVARFWRVATGQAHQRPMIHGGPVRAVGFSPDGTLAVTSSDDGGIRLWDVTTARQLGATIRRAGAVGGWAFLPDSMGLVVPGSDRSVRLWRVPRAMPGKPEAIALEIGLRTKLSLDENDVVRPLTDADWARLAVRRKRK